MSQLSTLIKGKGSKQMGRITVLDAIHAGGRDP